MSFFKQNVNEELKIYALLSHFSFKIARWGQGLNFVKKNLVELFLKCQTTSSSLWHHFLGCQKQNGGPGLE